MTTVSIHPLVDEGLRPGSADFSGGVLVCLCEHDPVTVKVDSSIVHNHACGCTKCWKPAGADFSIVAVAPTAQVSVTANAHKLKVVDEQAVIQRHACNGCGVHMHGPVNKPAHPFFGLTFLHPERFVETGAPPPSFAAFVSSVIEGGVYPEKMDAIRTRLVELDLTPYDCLNPPLMDFIAAHAARASGVLVD